MSIITRFAPSPTGFLHIGGGRTALFNWLYARHTGGKFLLRIEDTDLKRNTQEAMDAILDGLSWLGLKWDDEVIYQSKRASRHAEVAHELVKKNMAYFCYCSQEELAEMRTKAEAEGKPFRYDGRWRDRDPSEAPKDVKPVIRIKAPRDGETTINDLVQGNVTVPNNEIDDMIILRSDGTPTYMLAVVVDDHDMGITHVIRGDDHLTNMFRQKVIFDGMGWKFPQYGHIPLIHGPDGAKLSKRHGALGVEAYRDMGYLPEAMRNYLLRLGWSHGDDEIISTEQAIEWFNIENIGKSPSRFDFTKLANLNGHYMRIADNQRLVDLIVPFIEKKLSTSFPGFPQETIGESSTDCLRVDKSTQAMTITDNGKKRLLAGMSGLKERAKTLVELADNAVFYIKRPPFNDKAQKILNDNGKSIISKIRPSFENINEWKMENIERAVRTFAEQNNIKLGDAAQPLRAATTGSNISPSVFELMAILGKEESLKRLMVDS